MLLAQILKESGNLGKVGVHYLVKSTIDLCNTELNKLGKVRKIFLFISVFEFCL